MTRIDGPLYSYIIYGNGALDLRFALLFTEVQGRMDRFCKMI